MTMQTDPEGTEARLVRRYAELERAPVARMLELGCGDGRLTWRYARLAGHVTGIDLQGDDLRLALADRPGDLEGMVEFVRADATRLPFAPHSFDRALFAWSF